MMKKVFLVEGERVDLIADMEKLDRVYILFAKRTYSMEGRCISHPDVRGLQIHLKEEARELLPEAMNKLEELKEKLNKPVEVVEKEVVKEVPVKSGLGSQLEELMLRVLAEQSTDKVLALAKPMLDEHIRRTYGKLPEKIEIKTGEETRVIEGVTHEKFEKVLKLVNKNIPVFLTGPAGTGKNVICKQVAEAFGLDFYFTNAVTQEYQIKGFIDANGTYHTTQFHEAFTKGGLFFLDEMDGSIPETLIMLNSALANHYFDFPTGRAYAHPDFRVISAGNTVGTGADIEYSGRYQLDASSLDRFALIAIDYSEKIEMALANDNKELVEFARDFRRASKESGIRCLCTYRSVERISKLEDDFDLEEAIEMSLTKGLGEDDIRILVGRMNQRNKYTQAMSKLC